MPGIKTRNPVGLLKIVPFVLTVVTLACSLPGIPFKSQPTATPVASAPTAPPPTPVPEPLPPALVESDPPPGSIIPLSRPITLYFNQDMDRPTVEGALSGQPHLSGRFSWASDSQMTFTPDAPLLPDTDLAVTIGTGARSKKGLALLNPLTLTYHTSGYLRLAQALPAPDAKDVDPTSAVLAAFNRPVVPLGADPGGLPAAFTLLSPADTTPKGKGEWINTSTYIFYPQPALAGGQTFRVEINKSLVGADGASLEKESKNTPIPYTWTFSTAAPRLVSASPEAGSMDARLDQAVVLTFNQQMDASSVQSNFALLDPVSNPVPGDFTWDAATRVMTYTPSTLLARNTQYVIAVNAAAQAAGGTPLGQGLNSDFTTVSDLAVRETNPSPGGSVRIGTPVELTLSSYLPDDADRFISITPAVPNLNLSLDFNRAVMLFGDWTPETDYTVTVSPDLKDEWGQALGQEYALNFRSAPLDPTLFVNLGMDVLFLTPQDKGLNAQAANLSSVPISLGSVLLDDFIVMLGPDGYNIRQTFQPADMQHWQDTVDLPANRLQPVNLALTPDNNSLNPGLYYLRLDSYAPGIGASNYLLVVSNIQITYKLGITDALVWAFDLRTGKPVPNAPVAVYDEKGSQLAAGRTGSDGVYAAPVPSRQDPYGISYAVIGQPGDDFFGMALSNWNLGIDGSFFGLPTAYDQPAVKDYLYTDRPIYRPGQVVFFKAVSRQANNGRYALRDSGTISLTLYNQNGEPVTDFNLPLTAFGTAHGQIELSPDAVPGNYRLGNNNSSVFFQVANYRKPEINLQVAFKDEQALFGQALSANVNARYFFDAPVSNAPVHWALYSRPEGFDLPGYQVGKEDTGWLSLFSGFSINPLGEPVSSGESQAGPDGLLSLSLPTDNARTKDERRIYTLEATVTDESGLPVSTRSSIVVNPAAFYIGIKPDLWVGQAGSPLSFEVITAGWDKKPTPNRSLHAEFQKVTWIRQDSSTGFLRLGPTYTPQYTSQGSTDFSTGQDGLARLQFTPSEPGTYQVTVSGEGALTDVILWVGGPGQAVWPDLPNQRLRLTADREAYSPGDTAKIFIPNPFPTGGLALVTVERALVMSHQVVDLQGSGLELPIPLTDEHAPNVFISATVLGKDAEGQPDFRQGYIELPVKPTQETLNVTLTSQPQRAGPGDEVTFSIHVADAGGKPVQGEFSLSVVDLAIFALADPNSPDILTAFYGEQPMGVRTSLALAAWAGRNAVIPGGMGGGGGEAAAQVARENFPDTAYWNAEVLTDAGGNAQVTITLPDNLTTWQVDLRGVTQNTLVGQAQAQIVTSKELLVRPVTPRFLVVDDHAMLAAVVQNNTAGDLDADVSLQTSGFRLDDATPPAQKAHLPAGGRARIEWWGTTEDVDKVDAVFSASAGGLSDAARPSSGGLPVLHYSAPQTFATSGVLDGPGEGLELVSLPHSFDVRGGNLRLELSPSLAAGMLDGLDYLERYPYECNEQTLSRFLPNLEVYQALQTFGIAAPDLKARLDRTLSQGLSRLMVRQNQDGGWGWWSGEQSDPYVTAYILFGLARASQAGIKVDDKVIQRAADYLKAALPNTQMSPDTWQLDRMVFMSFALSEIGAVSSPGPDALYALRDQLDPWAQALLALTMQKQDPTDARVKTLLSDLQSTAALSATGAHWQERQAAWQNSVSPVTATAIVVYALAQREPASAVLPEAVRYIMDSRKGSGAWGSTYETAWSLMALTEVMKGTGELGGAYSFTADFNGTPLASGQAGGGPTAITPVISTLPLSSLYPNDPNALLIRREAGSGRLYYSAYLNVNRPVESVAPSDQGINISRGIYPSASTCPQEDCPAIHSAFVGDSVAVRLTLALPQDAYNLVVEDYIPAGSEILDISLKSSQQGAAQPEYDPAKPFSAGWGWWFFQPPQIYDDHIAWTTGYLPAGTYTLTYTLGMLQAGQYRVLPAHAGLFYFPEVEGISAGSVFEIKP